ncbi:serine hydrolase domain-containing protein [Paenibacillus sepulcri]
MEAIQNQVQSLLDELTGSGREDGVQVAVYHHGVLIVNACSGTADRKTGQPVDENTLFVAMSCSKGITATVIHMLAQQGKLDYDDRIADYWPAFAVNGKQDITIRHVLRHEAGIPQMPENSTLDMICNWDEIIGEVERLTPVWEPGTKTGYHGFTFGWILGEIAQRADGRPFAQIVCEEICKPLGISVELYFGAPEAAEPRIAKLSGEPLPWDDMPDEMLLKRMLPPSVSPNNNLSAWNGPRVHQTVMPASNGIMTANALARIYASLIGDGVDGVRLLTPAQSWAAAGLQTEQPDEIFLGLPIPKALGYWLGGIKVGLTAMGSRQSAFGHTGNGGMIGFADPEHNLAIAILKNRMTYNRGEQETDIFLTTKIRQLLNLPI